MSLTQYRAFVAACDLGSLRAAGAATGFSQPALSRQIAALERSVGVPLLHRQARGVAPTEAGAALLPHARLLIHEAARGQEAARAAEGERAPLLIGSVPSATAALVPHALARLRRSAGLECTVVTALTPRLTGMVQARDLRAAVVTDVPAGLPDDPDLRAAHLADDEMVVIVPADHAVAQDSTIAIERLSEELWVEDNASSAAVLRRLATRAGFEPRLQHLADDLSAKTGLVAAGLGVALVPGLLVPALRADVAVLRLTEPATRGIYLLTRRDELGLENLADALESAATPLRTRRA
ncbi:LysR family transcriptional regulator [Nocardioides sp. T2.26MG-1]|uniref:LysR family transcriptional regulator n=1 Tax=Nocardioides sp. T2.26MG-1 TaxID=3041166 RepID=UPI0025417B18|nr:LysR family transcriptional regulator [Nocardioides sp. T2.26MG-1]